MLALIVLSASIAVACALVCTPEICEGITQPILTCKGGIIKGGGFCHCTDVCAKVG